MNTTLPPHRTLLPFTWGSERRRGKVYVALAHKISDTPTLPGWSISPPAIERTTSGGQYPIFVLYDQGVSVGVFKTPMGALERIGNDWLTHEYLLLVSGTDTSDDSSGYPASEP